MLKKLLVNAMMFATLCGLVTTPVAKAGSASEIEKKSNAKVEKSHWGWTARKVVGTAAGIVAGGVAGFFVTFYSLGFIGQEFTTVETILNYPADKKWCVGYTIVAAVTLAAAAGLGFGAFKEAVEQEKTEETATEE